MEEKKSKKKELLAKLKSFLALSAFPLLPESIRNKTLVYLGAFVFGIAGAVAFAVLLGNLYAVLPFVILSAGGVFFFFDTLRRFDKNQIVKFEGNVIEIEKTITKTSVRKVTFKAGDIKIALNIKEKYKNIKQGDYIVVYIKSDSPYYETNGRFVFNDYLSLNIQSAADDEEGGFFKKKKK